MSDLIDRQAAIDAVKAMEDTSGKGEIAGFYNMILEHVIDKLIALSSAQPEPCNDVISRADAIDVLAEFQESVENGTPCYAKARVEMKALPSVQLARKPGRWIPQNMNKSINMTSTLVYYYPKCSICGGSANYTDFCPNCGADMRGDQNG